MPKVEVDKSAVERLGWHAERLGVGIGEAMHLALNALDAATGQEAVPKRSGRGRGSSPETHGSVSVMYGEGPGAPVITQVRGGAGGTRAPHAPSGPRKVARKRGKIGKERNAAGELIVDPHNLPRLTFARIRDAKIDGRKIARASWNRLLALLIVRALHENVPFEEVCRIGASRVVRRRKEDQGFVFYPEGGISVQGREADLAGSAVVALAERLRADLDVGFQWLPNKEALRPRDKARFQFSVSGRG